MGERLARAIHSQGQMRIGRRRGTEALKNSVLGNYREEIDK